MKKNVIMGKLLVTSSVLNQLLDALYALVLDYRDNGKMKMGQEYKDHLKSLLPVLKEWESVLPSILNAVNDGVKGGDSKIVSLINLGNEIKKEFAKFRRNEEFAATELDLLSAIGLYLRNDSPAAFKKLEKFAGSVSSWAARRMVPQVMSQATSEPILRSLVKKLVGRDDVFLSPEESKAAKMARPELYQQYLDVAKTFNKSWNDALIAYVRNHEKKLVPYEEVLAFLDSQGYQYRLVKGFTGLIDDQRRLYTQDGKLIEGVPAAITSPTVEMNPKRTTSAPWVFKAIKSNGAAPTYFYTTDFKLARTKSKFELVKGLEKKIPAARNKWLSKVKNFSSADAASVACAVLETLYQTSGRIGSKNNPTFGIGTLQVRHLNLMPNGDLKISYIGKDSVRNRHILKKNDAQQKWIVPVLLQLADGKEPKERLFSTDDGKFVPPEAVNRMFKSMVGSAEATVHKMRHFRGTALWNKIMEKVLPELEPKVAKAMEKSVATAERMAMAQFTKMAEKVGTLLNHVRRGSGSDKVTGTTALLNYIDPASQSIFFRALNLRPPRQLEKLLRGAK